MIGYVVLIAVAVCMIVIFWKEKKQPTEEKLQEQQEKYEAILKQFGVPDEHYKMVIAQSKVYNINNCPAVVWLEEDKVKSLIFRLNPVVVENELEDFMFIASSPLVDFRRFDGTEYPDWARQSNYIKNLFLPYAEVTKSVGGIDYTKQMYWIGTMCVYAPSLAVLLNMINRPLSAYEIRVENAACMKSDGSIPAKLLEDYEAWKQEKAAEENKPKPIAMEDALQNLKEALEMVRIAEQQQEKQTAGEQPVDQTDKVNQLVKILLAEGKTEELLRSTSDKEYQQLLFEKYGL